MVRKISKDFFEAKPYFETSLCEKYSQLLSEFSQMIVYSPKIETVMEFLSRVILMNNEKLNTAHSGTYWNRIFFRKGQRKVGEKVNKFHFQSKKMDKRSLHFFQNQIKIQRFKSHFPNTSSSFFTQFPQL